MYKQKKENYPIIIALRCDRDEIFSKIPKEMSKKAKEYLPVFDIRKSNHPIQAEISRYDFVDYDNTGTVDAAIKSLSYNGAGEPTGAKIIVYRTTLFKSKQAAKNFLANNARNPILNKLGNDKNFIEITNVN